MLHLVALASLIAVCTGYNPQQYPPQNPLPARPHSAPLYPNPVNWWDSYNPYPWWNDWWSESTSDSRESDENRCRKLKSSCWAGNTDATCFPASIRYFKRNGKLHASIGCPADGSTMSITTSDGIILGVGAGAEKIARCRNGRWQAQSIDGQFARFKTVQCLKDSTETTPTGAAPTKPFPSRPTPTRPHPTRTPPAGPDHTRTPPAGPDHTRTHPTRPHPTHTAPTKPEATRTHPTRPNPTHTAPTKPEATATQPTRPSPTNTTPTLPESTGTKSTRPEPTHTTPTKPDTTHSSSVRPSTTHASPTRPASTGSHIDSTTMSTAQ